jgi:folate-dependent phosphoribosylglycinamide formyltransferase PurN
MPWPDTAVLGFGKMPVDCTQILLDAGIKVSFVYETEIDSFAQLQALCQKNNVPFGKPSHSDLTELLDRIQVPIVIFSINNNYIFPPHIVEKKNMRIINFHNALLPSYPGHGLIIPPWVIFNGEKRHGVTWHIINERIDAGKVLCYEVFDVLKNDTALSLMMRCVQRGIALFARELNSLLDFSFLGASQEDQCQDVYENPERYRMHRKRDLPNSGYLDTSWALEKCSRFLRSMDYGPYRRILPPKIINAGEVYIINKYCIDEIANRKKVIGPAELILTFNKGIITLGVEREIKHGRNH